MTPAQREVFLIIDGWWKRFGYGPSLQEIRDLVDRPQSVAAIQKKVKALVRLGICKGQKHRARSVRPSGMRVNQIHMNLADLIASLPEGERAGLLEMAQQYQDALVREKCQTNFLEFVKAMWPGFIHGRHHAVMAKKFEAIAEGKLKRLIINMPPRHTKSEFASYLLPAWFLGKYPNKKIIQSSNTAELAVGFGRKVRNLVDGETYAKIFPNVALRHDSKAAGRWSTNANGEYFAIGVGGTVTGKGADLLIIDDPHSEQEAALAANDPSIYDKVYEWFTSGPRQRLQPGGSIVVVMTRWGKRDLTGQVLKAEMQRGGEEWDVMEFPAILPSGNPLWPEFWSFEELEALRNELPNSKWQAQYQQSPTSDTSAIIKREWWRIWEEEDPPHCDYTLMSWDTAFEKSNRADYSAMTLWGVFDYPRRHRSHAKQFDSIKRFPGSNGVS
jgi:hypothetical protein